MNTWRNLPLKAKIGAVLFGVFLLAAIIGPMVEPYAPGFVSLDPAKSLNHPSSQHLFGTTQTGQGVLSQVLTGIRQAWPEIRDLLATGHSLKDVWAWLKDIGIEVPYTRLSEYVNQMRRRDADGVTATSVTTRGTVHRPPADPRTDMPASTRNPLENVQRSEAQRPGFIYRPALPADEKDLI